MNDQITSRCNHKIHIRVKFSHFCRIYSVINRLNKEFSLIITMILNKKKCIKEFEIK